MTPHTRPFPRRPAPVSADPALVSLLTAANPLTGGATAQTLPGEIVFAAPSERQPYVPGTNKQQYLRGSQKQTKPFIAEETGVQYVPIVQVRANLPAQTLPSPIAFEEGYVPGSNKQQYVRGGTQSQYVPLVTAGVANTLPSPIVFNEGYVPGSNKQQYVKEGPLVAAVDAQTLPSPITWAVRAPYVPGANKQQYLRSGEPVSVSSYPGVSTRPSFPPGYYPSLGLGRMVQGESQVAYEAQQGPKNVLYFF